MTLIREGGELVAVVGRTRAYLLPLVERLPEADLLRRRTLAKYLYALAITTGRRGGPYRELEAEAFACRVYAWPPASAGGWLVARAGRTSEAARTVLAIARDLDRAPGTSPGDGPEAQGFGEVALGALPSSPLR